jgi:hypothetical protein
LWPPGPITLASAATRVLTAAARQRQDALTLFVVTRVDGQNRDRGWMAAAHIARAGVTRVLTPSLSARDRVRLDTVLTR